MNVRQLRSIRNSVRCMAAPHGMRPPDLSPVVGLHATSGLLLSRGKPAATPLLCVIGRRERRFFAGARIYGRRNLGDGTDPSDGSPDPGRSQPPCHQCPRHRGVAPVLDRNAGLQAGRRLASPRRQDAVLQRRPRRRTHEPSRHRAGREPGPAAAAQGLGHVCDAGCDQPIANTIPNREAWLKQVAWLQEKGVKFHRRVNHGMTHSLYISDPNGYGVEILYELPREVWEDNIQGALDYAEGLPTEGEAALVDDTNYPRFAKTPEPAAD